MENSLLLKHQLGADAVGTISRTLSLVIADFPQEHFVSDAMDGLEVLELKQRVAYLIQVLADYLPKDFSQTAVILLAVKQTWDHSGQTESWGSFTAWPLIDYVAEYGLEDPELALSVLKTLTPLFTAEFAIRSFIEQHFELTYQHLLLWSEDTDEHVRRLASEGIRPRLPWGKRLTRFCDDPTPIFPILERLKDDASLYVRRSVANNLNDIAKDNPAEVIRLCRSWSVDASVERQWLIRHALRGLVKLGHSEAFVLLGYTKAPKVTTIFKLTETSVILGNNLKIATWLQSESVATQKLVIDYRIHHVKANGLTTSKVFKWKNITLHGQQTITLSKIHPFKIMTTRQYYAGTHIIELLINGVGYASAEFELQLL